jgi:DNA-directed RNA polymerase specialized sigma24 family protein
MKSEKSLLRLAASAAAGWPNGLDDNARFANVVMPHIDEAYRLAHWLTGNRTDAEDVVQDASLRAFRSIRGFAGGSARAWLLSIARNTAYSWIRKNRPAAVVTVTRMPTTGHCDAGTVAAICASERSSAGPVCRLKLSAQLIKPI